MNIEKMFDPNSYTEKAMPFTNFLHYAFNEYSNSKMDSVSDAVRECSVKREETFDDVENGLFNKVWDSFAKETTLENQENFNFGFRMGALLMLELLGKGGELK